MLLIVFRISLEEEILRLLASLNVTAFTETTAVLGKGETGTALGSFSWPGSNAMILAAVRNDQVDGVVNGLKGFRDRLSQKQHGEKIPVRVFALPCEDVV